jgi:hypothetical protein
MLSDRGQDVQGKPGRMRVPAGDEFGVSIHKASDESDVSAQPIQLGNQQLGPLASADGKGLLKLRTPIVLVALDLDVFRDERAADAG